MTMDGINLAVRDLLARQAQRGLFYVAPSETVLDAARKMQAQSISAIVVCEGEGENLRLVGILSEKDISHLVARSGDPASSLVETIMATDLVVVDPSTPLMETAHFMLKNNIRHLPVIEDGKPLSTLSMRDVLSLLISTLENENDSLRTDLNWMRQVQGQ
jgi:signal-transduction protein with cAMP-binding, CBS, and nucleotidyltransferase domain